MQEPSYVRLYDDEWGVYYLYVDEMGKVGYMVWAALFGACSSDDVVLFYPCDPELTIAAFENGEQMHVHCEIPERILCNPTP